MAEADGPATPAGWVRVFGEGTDEFNSYFYHEATGCAMFEHPTSVQWEDWFLLIDGDSNAGYYYNQTTAECTWDMPEGFQLPIRENSKADTPDAAPETTSKDAPNLVDKPPESLSAHDPTLPEENIDTPPDIALSDTAKPSASSNEEAGEEEHQDMEDKEFEEQQKDEEGNNDSVRETRRGKDSNAGSSETESLKEKKHEDSPRGSVHERLSSARESSQRSSHASRRDSHAPESIKRSNSYRILERMRSERSLSEELLASPDNAPLKDQKEEKSSAVSQATRNEDEPIDTARSANSESSAVPGNGQNNSFDVGKSYENEKPINTPPIAERKDAREDTERQAEQLTNEYFDNVRKMSIGEEEPGMTIFQAAGDQDTIRKLDRVSDQLEQRKQQKSIALIQSKILKQVEKSHQELEDAELVEAMRDKWTEELQKRRANEAKSIRERKAQEKRLYLESFWTHTTSNRLCEYHWSVPYADRSKIGIGSPTSRIPLGPFRADNKHVSDNCIAEKFSADEQSNGADNKSSGPNIKDWAFIRTRKLPNTFTKESGFSLESKTNPGASFNTHRSHKTVGEYEIQVTQNLYSVRSRQRDGGKARQSAPLPPVKKAVLVSRKTGELRQRPWSAGSRGSSKSGMTKSKSNISTNRPQSANSRFGRKKHQEEILEKATRKIHTAQVNEALKSTGVTYDSLRRDLLKKYGSKRSRPRFEPSTSTTEHVATSKLNGSKKWQKKAPGRQESKLRLVGKNSRTVASKKHHSRHTRTNGGTSPLRKASSGPIVSREDHATTIAHSLLTQQQTSDAEIAMQRQAQEKVTAAGLSRLFNELDASGDGFVSLREIKAAIKGKELVQTMLSESPKLKLLLNDDVCELLFKSIDVDDSGDVSLEEFLKVFGRTLGESNEDRARREEYQRLFASMDKNGDGTVSIYELRQALRLKTDTILIDMIKRSKVLRPLLRASAIQRISAIFLQFDEDESGSLEWPEFERVCEITFR